MGGDKAGAAGGGVAKSRFQYPVSQREHDEIVAGRGGAAKAYPDGRYVEEPQRSRSQAQRVRGETKGVEAGSRAYRHCQRLTFRHYENFPVASWLIPLALRPHVAALYAFARVADDFADETQDPERALRQLGEWGEALERCTAGHSDHPIFIALAQTIRIHDLPIQLFRDLLTAFTRDVTVKRYATWEDLTFNYCRYSANPVGRLVLLLFGYRDPSLHELSDHICTALQLTNFWQDLAVDLAKGRIYVPLEAMAQYGVSESEFLRQEATDRFRALMEHAADFTERLFEKGRALPDRVAGRLRWELRATWLGGMTILRRVRAVGYDTFRRRPMLSAWDKARIAVQAIAANAHAPVQPAS